MVKWRNIQWLITCFCFVDLGQSIFYTTTCLLPFLNDDILSTLPYTMISTLATFPPFLHKDIIEYLSTSFLPMAIRKFSLRLFLCVVWMEIAFAVLGCRFQDYKGITCYIHVLWLNLVISAWLLWWKRKERQLYLRIVLFI